MKQTLIEQVDNALRNSFAAIKQDMFGLQSSINSQAQDVRELKANLEQFASSAVTTDKLNLVKIKIGELNDHLKRLWNIEEQLKALEAKIANKQFVNQQIDGVVIRLADVRNRIDAVAKSAVSEVQIRTLISDINRELNGMKAEVSQAKEMKGAVTQEFLEKVAFKLNKKIEELRGEVGATRNDFTNAIADLKHSSKNFVTDKQVVGLIEDINVEFDRVKEVLKHNSDAIDALREDLRKSNDGPKINLDPVFSNIESLKRDFAELRSNTAKESEVKSLSREMKHIAEQAHEMRSAAKTPVASVEHRAEKISPAKVSRSSKKSKEQPVQAPEFKESEQKKGKRPLKKTMFFADLLVAFGVIGIVVSLISYFVGLLDLSDKLAVGGVAVFILGLLFRIFVVLRRKNLELIE